MHCIRTVFCLFIDVCAAFAQGLSFIHRRVCRLHAGLSVIHQRVRHLHMCFHFMFENLILNYSLSLGLCVCALELSALGLGTGVVDIVCLSKC
jgi:hypothetical protein